MSLSRRPEIFALTLLTLPCLLSAPIARAASCGPGDFDDYSAGLAKKGIARAAAANKIFNEAIQKAADAKKDLSDGDPTVGKQLKALDASLRVAELEQAQCVVVIPSEKTISVFVPIFSGLDYGAGIVRCRNEKGNLGQASFVQVKGIRMGFEVGVKSTDQILLFMGKDAPRKFDKREFTLGGEAAGALGPVGRSAEAGANIQRQSGEILAYNPSKGLFLGASLKGAVIRRDDRMNDAIAGKKVKPSLLSRVGLKFRDLIRHKKDCQQGLDAVVLAQSLDSITNPLASQERESPASASETRLAKALSVETDEGMQETQESAASVGAL